MRRLLFFALVALLLHVPMAAAQDVFRENERLDPDRPEAWAMNYFTATSFMTAFGETPELAPGGVRLAVELGEIPHLDASQRQVGFNGTKAEDLNKSPVVGRLRAWIGLPHGFVAEVAYTPPVSIDGARPEDMVAAAIARRMVERKGFVLSARVFGQHGAVTGDVTCPAELAGVEDFERNPYGCQAASDDRLELNYYGVDATAIWVRANWQWHATLGMARVEPEVQVDAYTFDYRDRSRLVTKDVLPYVALGVSRGLGQKWGIGMEVLHVPLHVRREEAASRESDPLTSVRLQLRRDIR